MLIRPVRRKAGDSRLAKIARWKRARTAGLQVIYAARSSDLTQDLEEVENDVAWRILIDRASRSAITHPAAAALGYLVHGRQVSSTDPSFMRRDSWKL